MVSYSNVDEEREKERGRGGCFRQDNIVEGLNISRKLADPLVQRDYDQIEGERERGRREKD